MERAWEQAPKNKVGYQGRGRRRRREKERSDKMRDTCAWLRVLLRREEGGERREREINHYGNTKPNQI